MAFPKVYILGPQNMNTYYKGFMIKVIWENID